jgi:cob(I)alamin adenosyltransferase
MMEKSIYDYADQLIAAAIEKAEEMNLKMVFAIVDDGGNLVAYRRMKGSFLISVDVAQGKAFSALALNMPTHEMAPAMSPGGPIYGMQTMHGGKLVPFGGGYPLYIDGELVGGFGSSGGSVEEDMVCAEYAINKVLK